MHAAEAWLSRENAVALAREELSGVLVRNAPYAAKLSGRLPLSERPLVEQIRLEDAWYFVPFARSDAAEKPLIVRVNALTKRVVIDKVA
jgi:hypothetical protein